MKLGRLTAFLVLAVITIALFSCTSQEVTSAKVYIQQDNWDKAIEQLEIAVAKYPADAEAYCLLGEGYSNKSEWVKMNEMFDKSLAVSPLFEQKIKSIIEKNWVSTFNSGVNRINGDDVDGAIKQFETCILINPARLESYRNLAVAFARKNDIQSAIETYKKAIVIEPKNIEIVHLIAGLYFDQKEFQNVIDAEQKVLEINPEDADAIANIALAYDFLGNREKALETYEQALVKNPDAKDLLFNLARLYYNGNEYQKAIELFNKVIASDPEDYGANFNVGNAYLQMADDLRKKLVEKENNNQEVTVADRDELKSMFAAAVPYLEKAATINDTDPNLWNNLGVAHIQAGDAERGAECFKKAEELQNK